MRAERQQSRPLPVILPPLADELLSSWVNRHAAFVGVSGMRLLRHYQIDVPAVRTLDLTLTSHHATLLADGLRSSSHLIRSMTQSRHGKSHRGLVAINRPLQICRPCARLHEVNPITRGARLRSWMEGWRVSCPVCGAPLEDYSPYMRLFRADPADPWLKHNADRARAGETMIDRATRQGRGKLHARLMRGLLAPQAPYVRRNGTTTPMPRLLDLVVDGSEDFFLQLAPENWGGGARIAPLSVRIPVLAGIATVLETPKYWAEPLIGAAMPSHRAALLDCIRSLTSPVPRDASLEPKNSQVCGNDENFANNYSHIKQHQMPERPLFS